ncbi:MAG: nicotinate-nucleotide--dimethylbenzimidazole phosphoribosyltransferase, partial [Syntrophomonas sp.]
EHLGCRAANSGVVIFAGDNGISRENISTYEPLSSNNIVRQHLEGISPTSIFLDKIGKPELMVDVGLYSPLEDPGLGQFNVKRGTNNFLLGDALEKNEVLQAIETGRCIWNEIYDQRFDIIGVGEIGVGDTLCATGIATVITGVASKSLVAQGSSAHKVKEKKNDIISRALITRCPDHSNIVDVLMRFGGLEIAALTGFIMEAASRRIPVMLDGYVTMVAALLAVQSDGSVIDWLIASNQTNDRGFLFILEKLGLEPIFHWDVSYGEGIASALGLFLAETSAEFWTQIKILRENG